MAAKAVKKEAPKELLDRLVQADPKDIIGLMLWKDRHRNPEMTVQLTEKDYEEFWKCMAYLEVKPEVRIYRPDGLPAQEAIPAQGNRRAVPARAAEPPRPFVVVQVCEKGTGDWIKPIESDEEGAKMRDAADEVRRSRDTVRDLAATVIAQARGGNFSSDQVIAVAQAASVLAMD